MMRTTVNIEDDVYQTVVDLARQRGDSISAVISRLLRQTLERPVGVTEESNGWPVFDTPAGAPPISADTVQAIIDEDIY